MTVYVCQDSDLLAYPVLTSYYHGSPASYQELISPFSLVFSKDSSTQSFY